MKRKREREKKGNRRNNVMMRSSLYIPIAFVISHKWHCLVPGMYYLLCYALALIINFGFSIHWPCAMCARCIDVVLFCIFFTIAFCSMQFSSIYKCNRQYHTRTFINKQHNTLSSHSHTHSLCQFLCVFMVLYLLLFYVFRFPIWVVLLFCFQTVPCHFYHTHFCVCQFSCTLIFNLIFVFQRKYNRTTKLLFVFALCSTRIKNH